VSLYVREAGPADAPAVLFLHGLGLSSAMWQAQFERLADFYHCLAPDLPECGNSAGLRRPVRAADQQANDGGQTQDGLAAVRLGDRRDGPDCGGPDLPACRGAWTHY
jgi:pimeloyl-ACP methyl ester carboxylesterase